MPMAVDRRATASLAMTCFVDKDGSQRGVLAQRGSLLLRANIKKAKPS